MISFCDLNPTVLLIMAISVYMRNFNFMLNRDEHEKSFINSGLDFFQNQYCLIESFILFTYFLL